MLSKNYREISSRAIPLVFGVLFLCFSLSYWALAWTEPGSTPPGQNVATPLNVTSTGQTKAGWLSLYYSGCVPSGNCSLFVGKTGLDGYGGTIEASGGAWLGSALVSTDNGLIVENGRVGIGTVNPSYPLHVVGDARATRLCIGSDCRNVWPSGSGGGIDGSGNENYIPKFTATNTIGDSVIREDPSSNYICIGDCAGAATQAPLTLMKEDPIILLQDPTVNSVESGRIRFIEGSNWYGGYVHYDGSTNLFHIGVHTSGDQNPSNDNNAISIQRSTGWVGIGNQNFGERLEVNGHIKLSGASPNYRIKNLAGPVDDSDAATKGWVNSQINSGNCTVVSEMNTIFRNQYQKWYAVCPGGAGGSIAVGGGADPSDNQVPLTSRLTLSSWPASSSNIWMCSGYMESGTINDIQVNCWARCCF